MLYPKFVLFLLPCFSLTGARADHLGNGVNYLRKLKKDVQNDGDPGLISTEMMKTFDISESGLTFGDWINHYNATASSEGIALNGVDDILHVSTSTESDDLYSTDDNMDAPFTNNSEPTASSEIVGLGWNNGATAVSARKSGTITFKIPDTTHVGDTLFLFLSRTDGVLPLDLDNWNRGAECFKSYNRQSNCMREVHCIARNGPFCSEFRRGNESGTGRDLATVVFYRHVEDNDPCEWTVNLPGGTTTWAIVVSVPNVNREQPILRVAGTSCDKKRESVFPSVYGDEGNIVFLSQSFDDTAVLGQFQPPNGTDLLGWINDLDEAGFVYGKKLSRSGLTGNLITQGVGGPLCKDVLLSVIVNIDNSNV